MYVKLAWEFSLYFYEKVKTLFKCRRKEKKKNWVTAVGNENYYTIL